MKYRLAMAIYPYKKVQNDFSRCSIIGDKLNTYQCGKYFKQTLYKVVVITTYRR